MHRLCVAALGLAGCGRSGFERHDANTADVGPDAQICGPLSGLADDFESPGTAWWWSPGIDPPVTVAETNGVLRIALAPNNPNAYGFYRSTCRYDLRDESAQVRIVTAPNPLQGVEAALIASVDNMNTLYIATQLGEIGANQQVAGAYTNLGIHVFDPTQDRFWRLRATSNTIFFETSPDRSAWNVLGGGPMPFDVSSITISLSAGTYMAQPDPGVAEFDDLNL